MSKAESKPLSNGQAYYKPVFTYPFGCRKKTWLSSPYDLYFLSREMVFLSESDAMECSKETIKSRAKSLI